ncbi:Helix-loop-helix DNA-binding domain [Popillia japonica]|uniref:Helix-loop-helix DNA-binding domain n=1 Tax=Popillia japonica TaxID=7064 RepID=A0AAW1MDB6_POPJA
MDSGDCETEEDSAPEACVSPEGPLLPSNSREMRNRAEKMRRDKLNSYIGELATLVPMVAGSAKRMDKTSILRLTATHLRIYQTLLNRKNELNLNIPKKVDQRILEQLVCEQLKGFLMILTVTGKVVFVSYTVEHLLGHLQTDLMGQSIFNLISPEDVDRFRMYINPNSDMSEADWRKYFNIHIKRAGPRNESPVYELVNIMGMQRPTSNNGTLVNGRDVAPTSNNNDLWIFFVRVLRPESPISHIIEANNEYITRHLVDGRIINCDQRISFIAGYMIEEVSGLSAFKFMHREDVRWVMIALRQMYDKGESRGSSCYRLLSRTGQFIYLRTHGFLEVDNTGTVESFICVNTLVSEKDGLNMIKAMKEKYSALVKNSNSLTIINNSETQEVDDPQQLEAAIAHLVTNLPSPDSEHGSSSSPHSGVEIQDCSTDSHPNSHPWYLKMKTVKRPPNSSQETNSNKRHKSSQASTTLPTSTTNTYTTITDVTDNR